MPIQLSGSLVITGSITTTGGITISGSILSASYSDTASFSNNFRVLGNLTASTALVTGTLTAQTLVVQTVTSSIVYSSGSNIFGSVTSNLQTFTGSIQASGSSSHFLMGGSVGIGITNPTRPLHINAAADTRIVITDSNVSTTAGLYIRQFGSASAIVNNSNGTFQLATNDTYFLTANASGQVGIGTTQPTYVLDVFNSVEANARIKTSSTTGLSGLYIGNGNRDYAIVTRNSQGNVLEFRNETTNVTVMSISGSNVGIGTSAPNGLLSLKASASDTAAIRLQNNITSGLDAAISTYASSGQTYLTIGTNCYMNSSGNIPRFNTSYESSFIGFDSGLIVFGTGTTAANPSTRMIITSAGYVKISNTGAYQNAAGPYAELVTSANNNNILNCMHSTGTYPYGINIYFSGASPNDTTRYFMMMEDTTNQKAAIYSNGTFGSRTGTYGSIISDVKYKQDITDANSQWDDIKNLKVRNFKYKEDVQNQGDSALRQIGFIAQEVEQISPGLVYEAGKKDSDETWKSVKTSIIEIKAIKALQEAMAKIEILEAKVTALETK